MNELNQKISTHLRLLSQLKSLDGANSFSINSYATAAKNIEELFDELTIEIAKNIPGIGSKIFSVISELLETGESSEIKELQSRLPIECLSLKIVEGIGSKRALKLYQQGYHNFEELHYAAKEGKLDKKLSAAVILAANKKSGRFPREVLLPIATYYQEVLGKVVGVSCIEVGGSLRRETESSKDLDLLAKVEHEESRPILMAAFKELSPETFQGQELKANIKHPISVDGAVKAQVDLWIATPEYWGSLLNHATGSKEFNIACRKLAQLNGMKINEYGIFDEAGKKLGGESETDLFRLLNIPWTNPKDRTGILLEGNYNG